MERSLMGQAVAYRSSICRSWRARLRSPGAGYDTDKNGDRKLSSSNDGRSKHTALIRELGDKDLVTREVHLDILTETETHASELADVLKRSSEKHDRQANDSLRGVASRNSNLVCLIDTHYVSMPGPSPIRALRRSCRVTE